MALSNHRQVIFFVFAKIHHSTLCDVQVDIAHQVNRTGQPVAFRNQDSATTRLICSCYCPVYRISIFERLVALHLSGTVIPDIKGGIGK